MNHPQHHRQNDDPVCPKRAWTLSVLCEDATPEPAARIPMGLRFHLSRCPSCRALAERLGGVTVGLACLADQEPPASLSHRARIAAKAALEAGNVPRIDSVDAPDMDVVLLAREQRRRARRRFWGRASAVAAGLMLLVLFGHTWRTLIQRARGPATVNVQPPAAGPRHVLVDRPSGQAVAPGQANPGANRTDDVRRTERDDTDLMIEGLMKKRAGFKPAGASQRPTGRAIDNRASASSNDSGQDRP